MELEFYKSEPTDKIWWAIVPNKKGSMLFSFDKVHVYSVYTDYPWALTKKQKKLFDKENPFWANFYKDRK